MRLSSIIGRKMQLKKMNGATLLRPRKNKRKPKKRGTARKEREDLKLVQH